MALVGAQFVNAVSPNPVGSLQAYAGASAPTGWLLCDGSSYSTTVYPELFNVLGYTYGGSSTTFYVPDLRGRVPMGAGTGAQNGGSGSGVISGGTSLTARTRGQFGGDERMQAHSHDLRLLSGSQTYWALANGTGGNFGGFPTGTAGSGNSENMPPFLVTNYIIKAVPDAPRSGLAYGSTPPIVTALPSNPQFGDVVTYIADAANGVAWNLQYDASGTYPWKFIGGGPMRDDVVTGANQASLSYAVISGSSGPSLTLPLAGDYDVAISCQCAHGGTNLPGAMSYDVGATSASDSWAAWAVAPGGYSVTGYRVARQTASSALTALVSKYKTPAGTATAVNFGNRSMYATPVRVKAA